MQKQTDVTIREVYELIQRVEAKIDNSIGTANQRIDKTNERIDGLAKIYVSKVEFWPIRTIVYTGAGIILTAVLSALVYLVVKQ